MVTLYLVNDEIGTLSLISDLESIDRSVETARMVDSLYATSEQHNPIYIFFVLIRLKNSLYFFSIRVI